MICSNPLKALLFSAGLSLPYSAFAVPVLDRHYNTDDSDTVTEWQHNPDADTATVTEWQHNPDADTATVTEWQHNPDADTATVTEWHHNPDDDDDDDTSTESSSSTDDDDDDDAYDDDDDTSTESSSGTDDDDDDDDSAASTEKPSTASPYNRDLCPETKSLKCGDEYVLKAIMENCEETLNFAKQSSEESELESYNLSAFMLRGDGQYYRNFCVDKKILDNAKAGYKPDELDGLLLRGALKIKLLYSGDIFYVPFESDALRKKSNSNSQEAIYKFNITEATNPVEMFSGSRIGLDTIKWFAIKSTINRELVRVNKRIEQYKILVNAEMRRLKVDFGVPEPFMNLKYFPKTNGLSLSSSKVKMTLTTSKWFSGKTYDITFASDINFSGDKIWAKFVSGGTARFATVSYENFRKDSRHPRSISLIPRSLRTNKKGSDSHISEHFKLVEIILMPPWPWPSEKPESKE